MLAHRIVSILPFCLALGGCSSDETDQTDHNRPATYGSQCQDNSACAAPFECLGPANSGPYWPICTTTCTAAAECPQWNATGHCSGPITPVCQDGYCDYLRCE